MSAFIREFEALLEENHIRSGSKVFEIAGLDKSMLSRIRAGARIQFDEIARVAAAINGEPLTYLRLLRARLLEECKDPRARAVSVTIAGDTSAMALQDTDTPYSHLPPRQASAIANIIANLPKDAGLRQTILWLGNEVFDPDNAGVVSSASDARVSAATKAAADFAAGGKSYRAKRRASKRDAAPPSSSHSGTAHGPGHSPKP